MTKDNSFHSRILITGLILFGVTLPVSKSISSILMGLVYAYCIFAASCNKYFRETLMHAVKQPLNLPIGIYLLTVLFSLLYSQNRMEGLNNLLQLSNLILVYLMVSALIDSDQNKTTGIRSAEYLLLSFVAGVFVLDLFGLLTYLGLIGNKKFSLPLSPLNMHHIWVGNLNAVGLYAAVSLLVFSAHFKRLSMAILLWSFILLGTLTVLLSLARTAWVGMIFTVIISIYFLLRNKRTYLIVVPSIIIVCVLIYLFNDLVHSRIDMAFHDITQYSASVAPTSLGDRFFMWKASSEMFLSHPILGVGIGDYRIALGGLVASGRIPGFILKYNQPHNMYLFALATTGLTGLFGLLFIFYKTLQHTGKLLRNKEGLFGFLSLTVSVHFMTAGLTESLFNIHVLICSFMFISGLCIRSHVLKKNELD